MVNERRSFISVLGGVLGALSLSQLSITSEVLADSKKLDYGNSDFWEWVRRQYSVSPNIMNLNNGGVSPQPVFVQDALDKYTRLSNEAPSYYMWRILDEGRIALKNNLSILAGCSTDEIAINRNSTESLNTIIFGLDLKQGDEIIISKYAYPNMMNAWKQREKRDGVKLVWLDFKLPIEDDEEILDYYRKAITPKTRIVHITHIINWSGQVLPARKIADLAHSNGAEVIVDGAHSFAHLDYSIPDLDCDYYGTSLHKWLCAPFGTGMLYIKKEKIKNIWALLSAVDPDGEEIKKFESLGTRNFPAEMAIGYSLDFHNNIGSKRKADRLFHLKNYWAEQLLDNKKIKFHTSLKKQYSGAIANISIDGKTGSDIAIDLWAKYRIHVVAIKHEELDGIRITPNIYTNHRDLDKLVVALNEISISKT